MNFSEKLFLGMHFLFLPLIFLLFNASLPQHYIFSHHVFYDIHRIIELLILGLLGLLLFCFRQSEILVIHTYRKLPTLLQILIPLLFLFGLASSFLHPADPPSSGPLWVCHLAALFMGSLYVSGLYQQYSNKLFMTFLVLILLCGGYYLYIEWSYYLLTQYFTHFQVIPLDTDQLIQNLRFPQFSNPRFLGQTLSWVLPLSVLPYLFFKKNKKLSFLLLLIPSGLWQMFWMAQSRALYLELLLTALLLPLIFRKYKFILSPYLKAQGMALLLGLGLYILLYHIGYSLPERSLEENIGDSGRLDIWRLTLSLILNHPFMGIGPLNFIHYAEHPFNISHPHNAFLFITVEWGIPAGIIFLLTLCWGFVRWLQWVTKSERHSKENLTASFVLIALTTSLLSGLINSAFSGTLLMPVSQVFLSIITGLSLGIYQFQENLSLTGSSSAMSSKGLIKILIIVMAFFMLKGLFPTVLHLPEQERLACHQALDTPHPARCPIIPSYFADHAGIEMGADEQNSTSERDLST